MIEMLVAVVIAAIVTALILGGMKGALIRSYGAVCLSNLRTLAGAHLLYKGDHQDQFVLSQDANGILWTAALRDEGYLEENTKAFFCPAFDRSTDLNTPFAVAQTTGGNGKNKRGEYSHYGYNANHVGSSLRYGGTSTNTTRGGQLSHPSQTILLADSIASLTAVPPRGTFTLSDISGAKSLPQARHLGAVNVAFADGHAAPLKMTDTNNMYAPAPDGLGRLNDTGSLWKH